MQRLRVLCPIPQKAKQGGQAWADGQGPWLLFIQRGSHGLLPQDFTEQFQVLLPKDAQPCREVISALLEKMHVDKRSYQIGKTKVRHCPLPQGSLVTQWVPLHCPLLF